MRLKVLFTDSFQLVAIVMLVLLGTSVASAQTSSFTYQGRLTDGGTAANGLYDLQFALFDSLSGGTQIGSTQTLNGVAVSNGVFTVSLDFGASSFTGANRFLEISARPSGAGSLTLLTPRQQVTATPYAIRSANASLADSATNATNASTATNALQLGGVIASQFVQTSDSRLTDSRPPTPGAPNYIQTNPSSAQNANFNVSGNGTVGGTLSAAQFNIGSNRVLAVTGDSNAPGGNTFVGIGTGTVNVPSNSGGSFNSFFGNNAGLSNTSGTGNTLFGVKSGSTNATGAFNTLLGAFVDVGSNNLVNASAIGAFAEVTKSNSVVLGNVSSVTIFEADGSAINAEPANVGIGTTTPSKRLEVGTSAVADGINLFGTAPAYFLSNAGKSEKAALAFAGSAGLYSTDAAAGDIVLRTNSGRLLLQHGTGGAGLILNSSGGTVSIPSLGSGGTATVCRNSVNAGELAFCSSSLRYKSNVQTFLGGLDIINHLRPISFKWKQDGAKDIGLGAEEVEQVEPLLTFRNAKGEIEGVKYNQLSAVFINAFKEQQAEIEALRQANVVLITRLRSVENRMRNRKPERSRAKKIK